MGAFLLPCILFCFPVCFMLRHGNATGKRKENRLRSPSFRAARGWFSICCFIGRHETHVWVMVSCGSRDVKILPRPSGFSFFLVPECL